VRVLDASGNTFTGPMAIAVALTNSGGATLLGTTSVGTTNGVATFADLRIEKAGVDYVLAASAGTLTGATSDPFDVEEGAATTLRFISQPGLATAGRPFAPAVTVEITDVHDNRVTSATNAVSIAVVNASAGGYVTGTTTVNAVAGVATFDRATVNKPGSYALRASAPGLAGTSSLSFGVQRTPLARFCPAEIAAGASFDNFAAAVESTEPGGTIAFCDGVHQIATARIAKSLTVTAENAHKATLSAANDTIFWFGDATGTYTVRDLNFMIEGGVAVAFGRDVKEPVIRRYDQVLVENNRFTMPPLLGDGVVISMSGNPGAKAIVRGNAFTGGKHSVRAYYADIVDIVGNSFDGQVVTTSVASARAIDVAGGGPVLVRNNAMTACPGFCILAQFATVEVADNLIEASASSGTLTGVTVNQSTAKVSGNIIRGESTVTNRQDAHAYSFLWAGIMVQGAGDVTVIGNSVSNAQVGISSKDGSATGSNNTVTLVRYGVEVSLAGPTLHRNDLTDYIEAVMTSTGGLPPGMLSCNYWGKVSGPTLPPELMPVVTPFSAVPIADKSEAEVRCP
jgi:parallel beta-helix repeat protein